MEYKIKELTPESMRCMGGLGCPAIYEVSELTPESMRCGLGMGCPSIYETKEITPESMRCWAGVGCPSIYETKEITPESMVCGIGACYSIFEAKEGLYLIIGEKVNPSDAGLEKKVGENEALIKVPKKLIDEMRK